MINYRYKIKDHRGFTMRMVTGEVSDKGEVVINLPTVEEGSIVAIQWEVDDGNVSNSQQKSD